MRIAPLLASLSLIGLTGCFGGSAPADGDRPVVLKPEAGKASDAAQSTQLTTPRTLGSGDRVLAEVAGVKIAESELLPVLYESYGLDVLLKIVQLDLAKAVAAKESITVSGADIAAERELTLKLMFADQKPEDFEELLTQLLNRQHVQPPEFAIVMETNAYLRALVRKASEADINDDAIRAEFNAVYGERVRIRHIALNNLQEVAEAQRRLRGTPADATHGPIPPEPFEDVARAMSVNKATAANGGELPPFARTSAGYSNVFVEAAFATKTGEVSADAVQEGRFYHLIQVIERIEPKVVKYEDVRDSVREELIRKRQNALMSTRRAEMAQLAIKQMQINEPILKKQFADRLAAANPKAGEKDEVRRSLDEQREKLNEGPAPSTAPTTLPAIESTKTSAWTPATSTTKPTTATTRE